MAVAVFDIHIDRKAVANIKPSYIRAGLTPVNMSIFNAILLWRFHFCIARATINPPINRNIT